MDYADALASFYSRYGPQGFENAFFARAVLSDSVGGSVPDKRLIDALYALFHALDIVALFQTDGLEKGRGEIIKIYDQLEGGFTRREVVAAVNPLSALLCPNEFAGRIRPAMEKKNAAVVLKKEKSSPKRQSVRIDRKSKNPTPAAPSPKTPNKAVLPKKPAKKALISIKNIDIRTNARSVYFHCGDVKEPEISVNGQARIIDYSQYAMNKNSVLLPIDSPNGYVTLTLPKKKYGTLSIAGSKAEIRGIVFDDKTHFKSIQLLTKFGPVSFSGDCDKLAVRGTGDAKLSGTFDSIEMKVERGKAGLLLFRNPKRQTKIRAFVPDGSFKGKLFLDRLHRPIGGVFRRLTSVKTIASGDEITLDLEIRAGKGVTFR